MRTKRGRPCDSPEVIRLLAATSRIDRLRSSTLIGLVDHPDRTGPNESEESQQRRAIRQGQTSGLAAGFTTSEETALRTRAPFSDARGQQTALAAAVANDREAVVSLNLVLNAWRRDHSFTPALVHLATAAALAGVDPVVRWPSISPNQRAILEQANALGRAARHEAGAPSIPTLLLGQADLFRTTLLPEDVAVVRRLRRTLAALMGHKCDTEGVDQSIPSMPSLFRMGESLDLRTAIGLVMTSTITRNSAMDIAASAVLTAMARVIPGVRQIFSITRIIAADILRDAEFGNSDPGPMPALPRSNLRRAVLALDRVEDPRLRELLTQVTTVVVALPGDSPCEIDGPVVLARRILNRDDRRR